MADRKEEDPVVAFRCPESIVGALVKAAGDGDRSRSAQILRYVREGLMRDGLLRAKV